MTSPFRRLATSSATFLASSTFPYAIVIGTVVGIVAVLLIVVGFVLYCKERKRNKELAREAYLILASTPPGSHVSLGIVTTLQPPAPSVDAHAGFYVMTSPRPRGARPSAVRTSSSRTSDSLISASKGGCINYDMSTRSRDNSVEIPASFRRNMGLSDTTSSTQTASSNSKATFESRASHGEMWHDPILVAARLPMDKLAFGDVISRGGFGEVLKGVYKKRTVAIKRLLPEARKDLAKINEFLVEIKLQATLEHERVVQFVGLAWDSLTELCVVSEFMDGGDLRALLITFDEPKGRPVGFDLQKARVALDVAHALTYLHSLDPIVLHRDLKSKNILLDTNWRAKLTDFGVSRERSDRTMTANVGTSLWMAPEVMMGEQYDEKADLYSFGVVLGELDTHTLPYAGAKVTETGRTIPDTAILQLVSSGRLSVDFTSPTSPALEAMVHFGQACVAFEPDRRPTASQALYQLQLVVRALEEEAYVI